jgi:hypothetical protein
VTLTSRGATAYFRQMWQTVPSGRRLTVDQPTLDPRIEAQP